MSYGRENLTHKRDPLKHARIQAKVECISVKTAILDAHTSRPYEEQDHIYVRSLRERVAQARQQLRAMTGCEA